MHLTATTPFALVLCITILWLGPARGLSAMFATLPFGSAAAVNISGLGSVFLAEVAMVALGLSVLLSGAKGRDIVALLHPRGAGLPLLLLMIATGIGALFLPRINANLTEVFTLVRQADGATISLGPLHPTGSNTGQFFRFALAGLAFAVVALTMMRFATARAIRNAVIWASFVHIGLAILDLSGPLVGLNILSYVRNAYVAILDDQVLLGVRRLIGGFSEPSAFGIYTIGLFGFWLRIWFDAPRSLLASFMLLVLVGLLVRSTSTAAYFGLALYTLVFFAWQLRTTAKDTGAAALYVVLSLFIPLVVGGLVLSFQLVPAVADFLDTIVLQKMQSTSGNERLAWNLQALQNFADTYGLGVGIGSLRASGWPFAVLGSLGLVGTIVYLWFLLVLFRARFNSSVRHQADGQVLAAIQSGCLAVFLLSFSILPQPNLGFAFFAMAGLAAGIHLRDLNERWRTQQAWFAQLPAFKSRRV